jgi:two-component system, LuxR family, sensor kinase FixL
MNPRAWGLLTFALFFAIVAIGSLGYNLLRLRENFEWVRHTQEVLSEISRSETALLRAESGERGYVLSGDQSYLDSYRDESIASVGSLDRLAQLVADDAPQAGLVRDLRTLVEHRLDEFREVVELGPQHREEALGLLATVRVRSLTQLIRTKLREFRANETELLEARQADVDRVARQVTVLGIAMTLLSVGAAASGAYALERQRALTQIHAASAHAHALQAELLHVSRLSNMGEMASALAHELNQPLSALGSYLQGSRRLLERGGDDSVAQVKDALGKANEQVLRAGRVIQRLREFVQRGETEKRVESLARLVEESIALARVASKDSSVRIGVGLDPSCDLVMVDKIQIQQVLLNLLRNGIEATNNCEQRELRVASRPVADGLVEVTVTDTGAGLSPEVAARLFQPFVTTKAGGLGVGLSICRTIVEAHGGKIAGGPNVGGGTAFSFTLRTAEAEQEDEAA